MAERSSMELMIGAIVCAVAAVAGRIFYENSTFKVTRYTITHKDVTKKGEGLRIAFLSDLHNTSYGRGNSKLLQAIQDEKPDLILIGGDMLIGKKGNENCFEHVIPLLQNLVMHFPVYYANGNHETRMKFNPDEYDDAYRIYEKQLREMGVHLLCNETVVFPEWDVAVTGLELEAYYYQKRNKISMTKEALKEMAGNSNAERFQILLAHTPVFFPEYSRWGANLTLSGHNHGGIIRIPFLGGVISPQYQLFPKYDGGLYKEQENFMVLSRGMGTHTIKVRLFNVPELCFITLKGKE